jgi:hypothetical protein
MRGRYARDEYSVQILSSRVRCRSSLLRLLRRTHVAPCSNPSGKSDRHLRCCAIPLAALQLRDTCAKRQDGASTMQRVHSHAPGNGSPPG